MEIMQTRWKQTLKKTAVVVAIATGVTFSGFKSNPDALSAFQMPVAQAQRKNDLDQQINAAIARLKDNNPKTKAQAAWTLGSIADENPGSPKLLKALAPLAEAMKDKNADVLENAASALVSIGAAAVPALIKASKDSDRAIRKRAMWAIGRISNSAKVGGAAIDAILERLSDDRDVQLQAVLALGFIGDLGAVPALIKVLKDKNRDATVREEAVKAVGRISVANPGSNTLAELAKATENEDSVVKEWVTQVIVRTVDANLTHIMNSGKGISQAVEEGIRCREKNVASRAARGLQAIPQLMKELENKKDPNLQDVAAEALGRIARKNPNNAELLKAVPLLIRDLDGPYFPMNHIQALIGIGDRAVPALIKALRSNSEEVSSRAALALGKIGNRKALPELKRLAEKSRYRFKKS